MKLRKFKLYVLLILSALIILTPQVHALNGSKKIVKQNKPNNISQNKLDSQQNNKNIDRKISVIISGESSSSSPRGTGVIVKRIDNYNNKNKAKYIYLVLTNNHVVKSILDTEKPKKLVVTTQEKENHSSFLHPHLFDKKDLKLVYFYDSKEYPVAKIEKNLQDINIDIFAIGYPCSIEKCDDTLKINEGKKLGVSGLNLILKGKVLIDGYSIPHSAEITQGMSGGALVNKDGVVIAINGKTSHGTPAITNVPNMYQIDTGKSLKGLNKDISEIAEFFSWAISIDKYQESIIRVPVDDKKYFQDSLKYSEPYIYDDQYPVESSNDNVSVGSNNLQFSVIIALLLLVILIIILIKFNVSKIIRKLP